MGHIDWNYFETALFYTLEPNKECIVLGIPSKIENHAFLFLRSRFPRDKPELQPTQSEASAYTRPDQTYNFQVKFYS